MSLNKSEHKQAKDFSSLFNEIRTDLAHYVNNRVLHYRLDFLERISKSASLLSLGLIVAFLSLSLFSFGLMALGFYLGEILESNAAGFGVVALIWLFLLMVTLLFRNPIKNYFLNRTVRIMHKIEKEEDDYDEE